jgi:(1->4)-alpha-D-glucan 1-alpha-D-glucosylmutase
VPDGPVPDGPVKPHPVSTYRLQLRPGFGFADAAAIADYLASLGVTHVYLSPILQAAPGSPHGYDVVDHSRISADLGGEAGFRAMAERMRRHGLGVIVDIVPNHMAIPVPESLNRQLWSVLRDGADSPYAHWFDVDWAAQEGRLLLPILAGPVAECRADLRVEAAGGQEVLRYFGHVLPLRPGTAGLPLPELLSAQHYRLAGWRDGAAELNWRRFFDITSLIAIRVEDAGVFAATHGLLLRLVAEGLIDGLRVDHPDGLADPRGYLRQLAAATGGTGGGSGGSPPQAGIWVVTEKILTGTEELPSDWPCAGTTGYDTVGLAGGLFIDPDGREPLTSTYLRFITAGISDETAPQGRGDGLAGRAARGVGGLRGVVAPGQHGGFAEVAQAAKRDTAARTLAAELARLTRLLTRAGVPELGGLAAADVRSVLVELLAAFGVYRAYVVPGEPPPPSSAAIVHDAAQTARRKLPARLHAALDAVCALALGEGPHAPQREFIVRFQQTCGPVMAKGVEDTAFYRWSRLVALNEVGGEPDRFGVSPADFHAAACRLARDWPATMTTLSTHDTKRQEDVRARLSVLAEIPQEWEQEVTGWRGRAAALSGGRAPEPDTEYLMWQTLIGAWPIERDRLAGYLTKAMREAKTRTSWTDPDHGYESAVLAYADAVLGDPELTRRIARFAAQIAADARANSLGAKLVQLTMPGVADIYQGCELTGLSLVDPDNRRPVDFALRRRLLDGVQEPAAEPGAGLDAEKMLVTARALRLRRDHPDWFAGSYAPVYADGPAARHAVAFDRAGDAVTVATRLPAGLRRIGGWADTAVTLPQGRWRDMLTGTTHTGTKLLLSALMRQLPVAVLVREGAGAW